MSEDETVTVVLVRGFGSLIIGDLVPGKISHEYMEVLENQYSGLGEGSTTLVIYKAKGPLPVVLTYDKNTGSVGQIESGKIDEGIKNAFKKGKWVIAAGYGEPSVFYSLPEYKEWVDEIIRQSRSRADAPANAVRFLTDCEL